MHIPMILIIVVVVGVGDVNIDPTTLPHEVLASQFSNLVLFPLMVIPIKPPNLRFEIVLGGGYGDGD